MIPLTNEFIVSRFARLRDRRLNGLLNGPLSGMIEFIQLFIIFLSNSSPF